MHAMSSQTKPNILKKPVRNAVVVQSLNFVRRQKLQNVELSTNCIVNYNEDPSSTSKS